MIGAEPRKLAFESFCRRPVMKTLTRAKKNQLSNRRQSQKAFTEPDKSSQIAVKSPQIQGMKDAKRHKSPSR